jgi:hypothetical protein
MMEISAVPQPIAKRTKQEHSSIRRPTGREPMLRLIIEDVAELAALAAFAGTVLCWANAFVA